MACDRHPATVPQQRPRQHSVARVRTCLLCVEGPKICDRWFNSPMGWELACPQTHPAQQVLPSNADGVSRSPKIASGWYENRADITNVSAHHELPCAISSLLVIYVGVIYIYTAGNIGTLCHVLRMSLEVSGTETDGSGVPSCQWSIQLLQAYHRTFVVFPRQTAISDERRISFFPLRVCPAYRLSVGILQCRVGSKTRIMSLPYKDGNKFEDSYNRVDITPADMVVLVYCQVQHMVQVLMRSCR